MKRNEILESLCYYDKRNPNCIMDDDIYEIPNPCYCDHCFHGNADLAEELLKLFDENELLKSTK
jgi:hypothetical protein